MALPTSITKYTCYMSLANWIQVNEILPILLWGEVTTLYYNYMSSIINLHSHFKLLIVLNNKKFIITLPKKNFILSTAVQRYNFFYIIAMYLQNPQKQAQYTTIVHMTNTSLLHWTSHQWQLLQSCQPKAKTKCEIALQKEEDLDEKCTILKCQ